MPPSSQSPPNSGFQATKKACAPGMRAGEWVEESDGEPFDDMILLNNLNLNRLLAEMWTSMASGPAIDDQNDARWGSGATTLKSAPNASAFLSPGDADFDPNDLTPAGSIAVAQPSRTNPMVDWDDLDDDEDEFYGR